MPEPTNGGLAAGATGTSTGNRPVINGPPPPPTGLTNVRPTRPERLPLGERLGWFDELTGGIVAGGTYLLAGAPGGGKSRLATQIALALGAAGIPSLTILTEETSTACLTAPA